MSSCQTFWFNWFICFVNLGSCMFFTAFLLILNWFQIYLDFLLILRVINSTNRWWWRLCSLFSVENAIRYICNRTINYLLISKSISLFLTLWLLFLRIYIIHLCKSCKYSMLPFITELCYWWSSLDLWSLTAIVFPTYLI